MIDPSRLSANTFAGRLLRWPLRLVPKRTTVRILRGPARGMRWIVGAGVHGYWLGVYEPVVVETFAAAITPGAVVWDVGAHVGYYTLAAAGRGARRVHAFEPFAPNLSFLGQHVRLNALDDCVILHPVAVGAARGRAFFAAGDLTQTGHLASSGMPVEVVALDDAGIEVPSVVKIDVEGAELDVLRGMARTLRSASPTVFVATHSDELRRACEDYLRAAGHEVVLLGADTLQATFPRRAARE